MIENQALLSAIVTDPNDDRPRLVYADWLEKHGQLDRARLMRVQIELARPPDNAEAATALQIEEEQLEAACEKTLPQLEGISWGGFERGLVTSVYAATPAAFLRHASNIANLGSVHRVSFANRDDFAVLAEVATLARFTDLSVREDDNWGVRNGDLNHRFNEDLHAVLASAHCPRLRSLDLNTCQLGPRGARSMANCSRLEALIHLDLLDNYIGDEGMAALAASPHLSALRSLRIDLNNIGPAGVEALAASESLGGLEDLFLGEFWPHYIGPSTGLALARSPYLTHLRELSIHDEIGAVGAAALAQAPNLFGLTYLDIRCRIGPEGARALAASPYLRQLKQLQLHYGWIGDEGADALANSPILATLEHLGLLSNNLTDEGARAIAASPFLQCLKLRGLVMGCSNSLTEDGWQALRARFGDAVSDPIEALPQTAPVQPCELK